MTNSFSISTMRWLYRMFSVVYLLSSFEFGSGDFGMANGFEVPSRYTHPTRIHESTSSSEEQSSKSSPARCKYDLGLGKNGPLLINVNRQKTEGLKPETVGTTNFDKNDSTSITTYDACRFLVEHEATRTYPAPYDSKSMKAVKKISEDTNQASRSFPVATTKPTTTTSAGTTSETKARAKRPSNKSVPSVFQRTQKQKHPVQVQPKRLLEDCLTILDHDFSDSTAAKAAATVSTNSTIWSHPDTPQLDMNSVWVEMLLHNQMALSQCKG